MNSNLTEIVFLLDRSGSMSGLENDTIGGFNSFIKNQCELDGETIVTTVLFDDKYEILWDGVNGKQLELTSKDYYVRGATALLDAVGKTIINVGNRLANTDELKRPGKVIFVITTDGYENASREFSYKKIKEMITHQQEKYNWEFIFLGANIDTAAEANNLGISEVNAFSYDASEEGIKDMYVSLNESVMYKREK